MKLFRFFKKKKNTARSAETEKSRVDKSNWLGKDFEFLIRGDNELTAEDYDDILTPNTMTWTKIMKEDCACYRVGEDVIMYSWEMLGIQMTFNPTIKYAKAKRIADEVVQNLTNAGQFCELAILESDVLYRFD